MSLRYLTAGESHGRGLLGIIDGLPASIPITTEYLQAHQVRRKLGYGRGNRMNIESDAVEIISGVRHGKTLGSPIGLLIWNKDFEKAWSEIMQAEPYEGEVKRRVDVPRPGHADRTGRIKYGHLDMRNVLERSSARETTMRVALGSCARRFLEELGIHIASRVVRIGPIVDDAAREVSVAELNALVDQSPVRVLGKAAEAAMIAEIERAKAEGDTLGGHFEVYASGLPPGLGTYAQWDRRLEAGIGEAFLSLNAIRGVEMGIGFEAGRLRGSQVHDQFYPGRNGALTEYRTNRSGGIDGGMSTGQEIVVRAAMKPISTLMKPLDSVNLTTGEPAKAHIERSDTCAVPAAAVIGESLLALVLAEAVLEKFGGDALDEIQGRVNAWAAVAQHR
jgi:chorismate synthase